MYAEEVKGLKEKIRELQKHGKHEEKSFKKQQEYLVILEGKFREVCEKAGVSSSLNFTTAQEMNERSQRFKTVNQLKAHDNEIGGSFRKVGVHSTKNSVRSVDKPDKFNSDGEKIEVRSPKCRNVVISQ